VGDSSGGVATVGNSPAAGRMGGARVRTVVGGARSLTGGTRLVAGGHGGERRGAHVGWSRKEMEWAEPRENVKWVGPG
jgi:hypothetical protein